MGNNEDGITITTRYERNGPVAYSVDELRTQYPAPATQERKDIP